MSSRQFHILRELMTSDEPVTSSSLASMIEVSSRTIREDIKQLDEELSQHGAYVKSTRGKGYELVIEQGAAFKQYLSSFTHETVEQNELPNSPDARVHYLVRTFLLAKEPIKLDDLSEEIHVSKSTLQSDLKTVKALLSHYALELKSRPNYGLELIGTELNRRFAMSEYMFNHKEMGPDLLQMKQLSLVTGSDKSTLTKVWTILVEQIERHAVTLSDIALNNLFVHIAIAYKRIKDGYSVDLMHQDLKDIQKQKEYRVAKNIIFEVEKVLNVNFPPIEIAYIAIHLLGTKMVSEVNKESKDLEKVIDPTIQNLTLKILNRIEQKMNLGISHDKELIISLSLHLKPAINRYKFGMNIRNPMLNDIKNHYPLAFEAGVIGALVLKEELSVDIEETEVAYIALHIGAAMERKKAENKPKRCYIVCASGVGSSQLIQYRIKSEFRSEIDVLGVTEFYKIKDIPFDQTDFIISSVPLNEKLPVPVIEVNTILNSKDLSKIEQYIHFDDQKVLQYIQKENIFLNQSFQSKEEVLEFLIEKIQNTHQLPEKYAELIYEREKVASTAYGNLIAIPHPITPQSDHTFLTFCTLTSPIEWDENKVQLICILNVEKNSQEDLQQMYDILGRIVNSPSIVQQLIQCSTAEEFISTMIHFTG